MFEDRFNAFLQDHDYAREGAQDGKLAGLTFASKDVFDLAGHVTGVGQPTWRASHAPAEADAPVVHAMLAAGALLAGRTICDELCYSLNGTNRHDGDPINPRAPGRMAGGSSCGSAVAVAAGQADLALGTDCAGSVRVPAAFCGLYGIRPTYGRVSATGAFALAPSFDVVGWFAARAETFARAGQALLPDWHAPNPARRVLVAEDAFAAAPASVAAAAYPLADAIAAALGCKAEPITLAPDGLAQWGEAFRTIQGSEIRANLVPWVAANKPDLAPAIADRIAWASGVSAADANPMLPIRRQATARLDHLLDGEAVICLPTAVLPPPCDAGTAALEEFRTVSLRLTAPAGLTGVPQVHLPLAEAEGLPSGISVMAGRGRDEALLAIAALMADQAAPEVASTRA